MFELVFTPLRRVFLLFLVMLHASMWFFITQRLDKTEARAFIATHFLEETTAPMAEAPVTKKPKIPLLIFSPTNERLVFNAGEQIKLESNQSVQWHVDSEPVGEGRLTFWNVAPGRHVIQARRHGEEQRMIIEVQ